MQRQFPSMGGGVSGMYETMIVTILVASMERAYQRKRRIRVDPAVHKTQFQGQQRRTGRRCAADFADGRGDCEQYSGDRCCRPYRKGYSARNSISHRRERLRSWISSAAYGRGSSLTEHTLLIASGLAGISSLSIIPFLFYQFLLFISAILFIIFKK